MSKDLKHDSFAVDTFVDKALSHLKEKGIPVKRIVVPNTNLVKYSIPCQNSDIPVMRNYFRAKHGKMEADGAIGHLSMHLDAVVRSGSQEFSDAGEIV